MPPISLMRRIHPLVWISATFLLVVVLAGIALKQGGLAPVAPAGPRLSTGGEASKVPEANEYYERGIMIAMSRLDISQMRQMYEHALTLDPKFAQARAELAFMNVLLLISGQSNDSSLLYKAEEEARRALQDSPRNGRAHSVLAGVYLLQGRIELATGENQKALERNPNEAAALTHVLFYLGLQGRYSEGVAEAQKTMARFPLFFPARGKYAEFLQETGDNAGAIREKEKIVEQAPQNLVGVTNLSRTYVIAGDYQRARDVLERIPPPQRQSYLFRLRWALLLAAEGRHAEALKEMNADVLKYTETVSYFTFEGAEFFALANDKEKALDWLDRSVRKGDERAEWFQRDPLLKNVQDHPRFKQILDSIAYRREQRKK
jgi:adenylate cyclase